MDRFMIKRRRADTVQSLSELAPLGLWLQEQ